jgi:hypothetical protein
VSSSAVITAALLWMVVAIRLPTLTGSPAQRYLFVGLVALAVGFILDIPQVVAGLHEGGVGSNVPHLAKHVTVVVAASAVREVVRALGLDPGQPAEHRTRRILTGGGAVAALITLFALAPVRDHPVPSLTIAAVGEPTLLAYWAVYLAALGTALVGIARVCLTSLRTFPAGPVRTGMCWMGAGALLGLAYCGHKGIYLATATSDLAVQDAGSMETAQSALQAGCVLALVAGLLWPVAVRWPLVRHLLAYWTYRRLHPLWRAYVEAEPAIAFDDPGRPSLRDIELRLYRRVIEIRDGMLAVRPYAGAHLREVALREAKRAGHKNPDLIGEAAWLEVARRAKLRGDPPCQDSVPVTAGGADLTSETQVLTRIAKAWPTVYAIADQVETQAGARTSRR